MAAATSAKRRSRKPAKRQSSAKDAKEHDAPDPRDDVPEAEHGVSNEEEKEVKEHRRLRALVIYEIIRVEGDGELARGFGALWWSGLAAGISIGLSVVSQALLAAHLPDAPWKFLVEKLGYSVGFIVVIMARQQLFTENTLTAVLPVISRQKLDWLLVMLRLWGIVLAANMAGCLVVAATLAHTPMLPAEVASNVREIALHLMENPAGAMFVKGIAAGWIIAALVWMLPSAENTEFFLIGLMTYMIALGDFTHVVAGSVEAFYLWLQGEIGASAVFLQFFLPTLAGNVFGGTVLFAVLTYAQIREEIR
ncbi:MAG: formate/nitrite transporter family protein [Flavobacteriaceae bacterium]